MKYRRVHTQNMRHTPPSVLGRHLSLCRPGGAKPSLHVQDYADLFYDQAVARTFLPSHCHMARAT